MQGAEIEDDGSVLKYMTKSKIEEQRSSLLISRESNCTNTIRMAFVLFASDWTDET